MRYEMMGGPGACSFLHKRIGSALKGLAFGGPTGALAGFATGGGGGRSMTTAAASRCPRGSWQDSRGRCRTDSGSGPMTFAAGFQPINVPSSQFCVPPTRWDPRTNSCAVFLGSQTGRDDTPIAISGSNGEAVMGRYGAAYVPGSRVVDRAICLPGDVVGNDGLCYPKKSLKNSERQWPAGRKPLLTGGEMRAISIASRAAGRLTRTAVRLQDMGLIKKPVAAKPRKKS